MLIPSERHTQADLDLWAEYNKADLILAKSDAMTRKIHKARDVLRDFISRGHYPWHCYCSTSWGKDSVVVAHLCHWVDVDVQLGNLRVTPSRNPHCDAVRDDFLYRFLPKYHEVEVDFSGVDREIVGREYDRQTDRLWRAGFRDLKVKCHTHRHISGVRADESPGRLIRMCRWGESSPNACAPIGRWSTQDVFSYLALHNLPIHPNYAMLGGGRWPREHIRTAEIGDSHGRRMGRLEWEKEYYGDVLARIESL